MSVNEASLQSRLEPNNNLITTQILAPIMGTGFGLRDSRVMVPRAFATWWAEHLRGVADLIGINRTTSNMHNKLSISEALV